ncbi:MAG: hypothetical protein KatS3mg111_3672 [Pirellulaceae bacterium]|nr:MAG: hypothetical protein KatS3mg111_3672 [Pirellulaceae bacterium]
MPIVGSDLDTFGLEDGLGRRGLTKIESATGREHRSLPPGAVGKAWQLVAARLLPSTSHREVPWGRRCGGELSPRPPPFLGPAHSTLPQPLAGSPPRATRFPVQRPYA